MIEKWKQFRSRHDGAVLIEFAIVAPVLFMLMFGIIETGLIMLAQSTIESATSITSRTARIGNDGGTGNLESFIRSEIQRKSGGLINSGNVIITTETDDYGDIKPDECLQDPPAAPGTCPSGNYNDLNGNGVWDGFDLNLEGAGEVVELTVYYPYQVITPGVGAIFGADDGEFVITSKTLIVNEQY